MFKKPISQIILKDVEDLVLVRKERESLHLEYKESLGNADKDKKEFLKDISGFANASGGYLILGVSEKDGLPSEVVGVSAAVGSQKIDEWIDNVLIANLDELISYEIKLLDVKKKVVVIIHIPESPKKPHMVTFQNRNNYFVRHNTNVMAASQSEVREMFQYSRRHTDALETFLDRRLLLDESVDSFGLSVNSHQLVSQVEDKNGKKPYCLFSLIPRYLDNNRVATAKQEFWSWIADNSNGYQPSAPKGLLSTNKRYVSLHGVTYAVINDYEKQNFSSYFEIEKNGYVEAGLSYELMYNAARGKEGKIHRPVIHLTNTVGYLWMMLGFAERFYRHLNYLDEVIFQLSLVNIKGFALGGFGRKDAQQTWTEPFDTFYDDPPLCKYHDRVKLVQGFMVRDLNPEIIKEMVRAIAEQISNTFGETTVKCFDDEGEFNIEGFSWFRS